MSAKLFVWTGRAPRAVNARKQVACYAVFPSKAAFTRATGVKGPELKNYVSVTDVEREWNSPNPGVAAALAEPGKVFWNDTVRHAPVENVVLPYENYIDG